jgi:hypothetical protein
VFFLENVFRAVFLEVQLVDRWERDWPGTITRKVRFGVIKTPVACTVWRVQARMG